MTRYALISDIHSNHVALLAVLREIDEQGVDSIVCAGDIVGYNSQPNEVIAELRKRRIYCIRGNHDEAMLEPGGERLMNSLAAEAIRWNREHTEGENRDFISSLTTSITLDDMAVYHGSPFDSNEYIYADMVDEKLASKSGKWVTVLGHTHVPYVREVGGKMVVNPGSVGQPRDGDARASYAILDGKECVICRVVYDIEDVVRSNEAASLPQPLSERLRWGV